MCLSEQYQRDRLDVNPKGVGGARIGLHGHFGHNPAEAIPPSLTPLLFGRVTPRTSHLASIASSVTAAFNMDLSHLGPVPRPRMTGFWLREKPRLNTSWGWTLGSSGGRAGFKPVAQIAVEPTILRLSWNLQDTVLAKRVLLLPSGSMVVKFIKVYVKPGHMRAYLTAQEVFNRETPDAPGYRGHFFGRRAEDPNLVYLIFFWRSREDLDRWMAREHGRIAARAGAETHYDRIEVSIMEKADPLGPLPSDFDALEAKDANERVSRAREQPEPGTA